MDPAEGKTNEKDTKGPKAPVDTSASESVTVLANDFRLPYPMLQAEAALNRLHHPELYDDDDDDQAPKIRYRPSTRRRKDKITKPWLDQSQSPRERLSDALPIIGGFLGLIAAVFLVWDGWASVINHEYVLLYEDDFSNGLDKSIWEPEIQVGGFGNGEFEQTTDHDDNLFVDQDGVLNLKATLQDEAKMESDTVIDLLRARTCTSTFPADCVAVTNVSEGNVSVVPPTLSARITTKKGVSILYGRVCVTAKMPLGDWLWPAIWMMPVDDKYGQWPSSGEIDILECRGNNHTFKQGGNNIASSALHWGPDKSTDAWWQTYKKLPSSHTTYSSGFNTFCLEWTEKFLFTYVNTRIMQVLYVPFDKPLWQRGKFWEKKNENDTAYRNVWGDSTNAPFDQAFYLIISLGVGGTNGWFEDGQSGKPWFDASPAAKKDFWKARDKWYPTWVQPALQIKKVQMWQEDDGAK